MSLRQRTARNVRHACLGAAFLAFACVAGDDGAPAGSTSEAPADATTAAVSESGGPSGPADSSTGTTPDPSTSSSEGSAESDTIASTGEPVCEIATPLDVAPESLCAGQDVVQTYQPGMVAHGELGLLDVVLVQADPGPPAKGFNGWTLLVRDVATCTPQPGVALSVVPFMPMHGHGTATVPQITDHGDGSYSIDPLNLWMDGYWRVGVALASDAIGEDETAFHVCVE